MRFGKTGTFWFRLHHLVATFNWIAWVSPDTIKITVKPKKAWPLAQVQSSLETLELCGLAIAV